jgi:multidrug efflux system membrane fusion protein
MTPSDPPGMPPNEPPKRSRLLTPADIAAEGPPKPWYRRVWLWVLIVIVLVVAGLLWHAHERASSAEGKRAAFKGQAGGGGRRGAAPLGANETMPVGVATVKQSDVPVYLGGLGSVTPVATTTVKARVDGLLQKINFREGQIVKAGEVLAEIDPKPFQVVVEQAEGTLARDAAQLANAKVDYERYRKLVEQDSIATQQLDTQKALVDQLKGTVKNDQGNLDSAKLQLSYTKVTAPNGGRIGLRQVDVGNMVHASDTTGIVIITQLQPIDVVFSVPEANVQRIMKRLVAGNTLGVDAWDRDSKNKLADGSLLTVDNQIDVSTGTVKLKARFANAGYDLFPNQFVNARLALDVQKNAIVVPPAAVQRGAQGFYVYVVAADNTVSARTVKPGISQGDQMAIDDGLKVGEVVVVDGTDRLREGAKVEPVARDGTKVAAPPAAANADGANGQKGAGGTPEERQKRWEAIKKRIDAGEFGEDIKKLPEEEQKQEMRKRAQQRQGGQGQGAPQ